MICPTTILAYQPETTATLLQEQEHVNVCPIIKPEAEKTVTEQDEPEEFIDHDQDLKDLGTKIVVEKFFTTSDTLYNFMKLVYGNIDAALDTYKKQHGLEDRAIFLIFKGGNILRMVANEVFDLLPPAARNLLKDEYAQYFRRSDADFSAYVDETKLAGLDYHQVFGEVADLVFSELNHIREEFSKDAQKYFNIFQLNSTFITKQLAKYLEQLKELDAVKDEKNPNWFQAKFYQLQLLNERANPQLRCHYHGLNDYRFINEDNKIVGTRLTDKPNWLVNSDNRTIQFPLGAEPDKLTKFFLLRTKVAIEYMYEKDGEYKRKPVGAELIDVSMVHRDDSSLRSFLDNYDKNVAEYTLISDASKEQFTFKSYSISYLAHDLEDILFSSFSRPWEGGAKYNKRVYRLFFLHIVEMLSNLGLGSSLISAFVNDVETKILDPLKNLYPLGESSANVVSQIKTNTDQLKQTYTNLPITNEFWHIVAQFIEGRLVKDPKEDDQEKLQELVEIIRHNLQIMDQLSRMTSATIDAQEIYKVEIDNLL